ncbi:hypothetical protein AXK58_00030 [Tsukamurella tyrosinosolvens]|nr:hypothetical protein AXK58_00030 [Tsukamurella tyrosinosolvens]
MIRADAVAARKVDETHAAAAHHLAAVLPEEARIVGLDDIVDGWEQQLAVFYLRTIAGGEGRKQLNVDQRRR